MERCEKKIRYTHVAALPALDSGAQNLCFFSKRKLLR